MRMIMTNKLSNFSVEKSFSLEGKVAMITGANQGLGMGYAVALAKAGADLFIPHLTDETEEVKQLIEGMGRKVVFAQGDLTEQSYIEEIVEKCIDVYGKIDILINNAGVGIFEDFLNYPSSY